MAPPTIFISYSHRDAMWRDELVRHLRLLERNGVLRIWDTSEIPPGAPWAQEITNKLAESDLAVLLVSPETFASEFIMQHELPALIRRHRAGQTVVVPVLLRAAQWTMVEELAELQFANSPTQPLSDLAPNERDSALARIATHIGTLARAIAQQKQGDDGAGATQPSSRATGGDAPQAPIIFISHAREDGDFAELVKLYLDKVGHQAWIDTDRLLPGIDWREEIDKTIRNCWRVIAVMSPEARASEYVTYEWAFGWGCGKTIIPIMLRQTSLHPRIATLQYLDFSDRLNRPWSRLYAAI